MNLQKILLGPLLLGQGLWVRNKTPSLPEPEMKTSGIVGSGPSINLLLIGDSSAAGVGANKAEESLLSQLLMQLSPYRQVHYKMLAKTGRTTDQMLTELSTIQPSSYDVVITALGVNDVTAQVTLKQWQQLQRQLIKTVFDKFSPPQIIMSGLPPVREFPALPWPLNAYLGNAADSFNAKLIEISDSIEGVRFLSLRDYPVEAMAAIDGFHPGPKVYELWAQNIAQIILAAD
ncbi:MAG: SGNH/GDSL hydrolase family protein [Marinicella sp.]